MSCGCGARWNGHKTCHCSECHATFTSVTVFDRHRAGPISARYCRDLATFEDKNGALVFTDADREYPCWMLAKDKERPAPFAG